MSDLEKKKEKERWEQIRKTLSNKKRESQYRKTIIEREQSRKKGCLLFLNLKKNGGKNRKQNVKQKRVKKLKKPFSKNLVVFPQQTIGILEVLYQTTVIVFLIIPIEFLCFV